jgi:UMF1 family MFS transporter
MNELNTPKTIRAWTYYDWANSAYSLIITSAIFPAYYSGIVPEQVKLLGTTFNRAALASYSIALSFLLIAIISPILSSIADYRGNKKSFMKFFCYLGSAACMMMFFFKKNELGEPNIIYGLLCSIIASIGYCGSIVFYNAFLPEIATKDEQDKISAKGFAMGYIGSVLLMVFCFALLIADEQFGWNLGALLARLSFLLVGLWWILFAQIPFNVLQETYKDQHVEKNSILTNGYKELQKVWQNLTHTPALKKFLVSFFFYNMGVQTVMYMATYFASDELKMEKTQLLAVVLIIQLVAIVGARLFAYISQQKGNHIALVTLVIIWIGICISAFMVQSVNAFYALAFTVGLVMGGIQSLSRSTYSKLLPHTTDTASYFSFYDVCEKVGIVIGTLSFGLIADLLGGMRNSTLGLVFYFIIGLFLLLRLNKKDLAVMNQA